FADLTGEDVTTALAALAPALDPPLATPLAELEAAGLADEARPEPGEDELDAAVRVLRRAIDAVPPPAPPKGRKRSTKRAKQGDAGSTDATLPLDQPAEPEAPAPPAGPDLAALPTVDALREALEGAATRVTAE